MANRWLDEAEAALELVNYRLKTKWRKRFEVRSERLLAGYDLVVSALRWNGAWTRALERKMRRGREELLDGRRMSLMPIEEEFRGHWVQRTGFEWPGDETFFSYERPSVIPKAEWVILGAAAWLVLRAFLMGTAQGSLTLVLLLPDVALLLTLWGILASQVRVDVKVESGRILYRMRGIPVLYRQVRLEPAGELRCSEQSVNQYWVEYRGHGCSRFRTLFLTTTSGEAQRLINAVNMGRHPAVPEPAGGPATGDC